MKDLLPVMILISLLLGISCQQATSSGTGGLSSSYPLVLDSVAQISVGTWTVDFTDSLVYPYSDYSVPATMCFVATGATRIAYYVVDDCSDLVAYYAQTAGMTEVEAWADIAQYYAADDWTVSASSPYRMTTTKYSGFSDDTFWVEGGSMTLTSASRLVVVTSDYQMTLTKTES